MRVHSILRSLVLLPLFALCALGAGSEPAILAKARSFVGPAAKLEGIKSIHYQGILSSDDGKKHAFELIYQKPYQQRLMATSDAVIEITALDDFEGWQRITDVKDPTRWRQTLLGSTLVKRQRAINFDSLNLFACPPYGQLEDLGPIEVKGRTAIKVAFHHDANIIFYRYFDSSTGKLLRTETAADTTIEEEGEMLVDGIRFPKRVINLTKQPDGTVRRTVIEFDKVTLNETFASSLFAVPLPFNVSKPN